MAKRVKPGRDFFPDDKLEKTEILSEWSDEIAGTLEILQQERDKTGRHIKHLQARVEFLNGNSRQGAVISACLTTLAGLKQELVRQNEEIREKEHLLRQIKT
ncbi:MAG: hypothetical protein K6T80_03415 [Firmicutes bacterium]|nr:hypothetical protein [Bacillota bacterium]